MSGASSRAGDGAAATAAVPDAPTASAPPPAGAAGRHDRRRAWFAIGLCAAAVLLYQIAVTRLLSVVLWYHWAFLAVSMAMLGLGVPGVWFAHVRPGPNVLRRCLLGAAAALPVSVLLIVHHGTVLGASSVLVCMVAMLLPMLLLGAAVCALLLAAPGPELGRMYGADLIGAAAGATFVVPLLWLVDTPQLVAALGLLPLAAAFLLAPRRRAAVLVGAALLLGLCAVPGAFELRRTKSYDESKVPPLLVKWTPTARLAFFDVVGWHDARSDFGWGLGRNAPKASVPQLWMEQDGSAGTAVTKFDGDLTKLQHLLFDVTSVAYQLATPRRVAVVGAGGGRDVLSALLADSAHVDAVELNPAVLATIGGELREFAGDLYRHPRVAPHAAEGRSFLTRSDGDYDVVQISMIDSWAATAAGAFTLAENNLYTVEAYRLYWQRLSPRGIVTTSRWMHNFESLRLLGIHLAALRSLGVPRPEEHVAVVNGGSVSTLLLSREPFAGALLERLRAVCAERGFDLWYPDPALPERFAAFLADGSTPFPEIELDLQPSTDDRPFFFQIMPVWRWVDAGVAKAIGANAEAVRTLQLLVLAVTAVAALLFFAPFVLWRRVRGSGAFWRGSAFFALLGTGFMLLEMPWLQRFVLYLGHPSHAAAVVLGALLTGTGLGASWSARFGLGRLQRFGLLVPLLLGAVHLLTPSLFDATLGAPMPLRVGVALLLLVPAGCLLGLLFPLGMLRFGDGDKAWYWALNGACGVFASVSSLALAMHFGFTAVGVFGIACYVAAVLLLRGARTA